MSIHFLIHGPCWGVTRSLIAYINQHYPSSKVVFSTWLPAIFNLRYECVVNNFPVDNCDNINPNRFLVAIQNGLTKFDDNDIVVRLRSDIIIDNPDLEYQYIDYLAKYDLRGKYSILSRKVLVGNIYCINPFMSGPTSHPMAYHMSDWWCMGAVKDLKKVYGVPLIRGGGKKLRFEQYLYLQFILKYFPDLPVPEYDLDTNPLMNGLSIQSMIDNFIIVDNTVIKFENTKYPQKFTIDNQHLINHKEFKSFYEQCQHQHLIK